MGLWEGGKTGLVEGILSCEVCIELSPFTSFWLAVYRLHYIYELVDGI